MDVEDTVSRVTITGGDTLIQIHMSLQLFVRQRTAFFLLS